MVAHMTKTNFPKLATRKGKKFDQGQVVLGLELGGYEVAE